VRVADAHVDLLLEVAWRRGREEGNPFREHWLPRLEEGGVRLQVCPIYVEGPLVPDGSLRAAADLVRANRTSESTSTESDGRGWAALAGGAGFDAGADLDAAAGAAAVGEAVAKDSSPVFSRFAEFLAKTPPDRRPDRRLFPLPCRGLEQAGNPRRHRLAIG